MFVEVVMRKNRILILLAGLALMAGLTSCDNFFDTNLFKEAKIGQVESGSLETLSSEEILASSGVLTSRPSESFFTAFAEATPEARGAVLETLRETYRFPADDPLWVRFTEAMGSSGAKVLSSKVIGASPAELQSGYLLMANMTLNARIIGTSGISTSLLTIQNGVMSLLVGRSLDSLSVSDAYTVLSTIPAFIKADYSIFTQVVNNLKMLDDIYDQLASVVVHPNSDAYYGSVDSGLKGLVAQTAAIASVITLITPVPGTYSAIDPVETVTIPSDGSPESNRALALYSIVNNPSYVDGNPSNYIMVYPTPSTFGADIQAEATGGNLSYLLTAAGIDLASFSF